MCFSAANTEMLSNGRTSIWQDMVDIAGSERIWDDRWIWEHLGGYGRISWILLGMAMGRYGGYG